MIKSVLFVCTGNSCRSVMAEALLRKRLSELGKRGVDVYSAGVRALNGMRPTDETVQVMKESGIDVSRFRTKNITPAMIGTADLILVMAPEHRDEILALAPEARSKTHLLKMYERPSADDVPDPGIGDPIGKGVEDYRMVRDEIDDQIRRFADGL